MNRARIVVTALVLTIVWATPAAADPAGPTDYVTTVDSIQPPTDDMSVRMIGGDSFFELTQLRPVLISITGYRGEPYLRFMPDGSVEQNRLAPTTYLNDDRYGGSETVPDFADPEADPEWEKVADGGRYAWHDHRSHWMNERKPAGAQPGDTVIEAVIPVVVDGTSVQISVSSRLRAAPSFIPAIVGAGLATVMAILTVGLRLPTLALVGSFLALVAGLVSVISVPPETGPPFTHWVPPLVAVVALTASAIASRRANNPLVEIGLVAVAAVQLLLWGLLSATSLTKPILPTEMPFGAHRFIVAAAVVTGVGLAVVVAGRLAPLFRAQSG